MKKKLLDVSLPEQQNQDNETCSLIRMGTFFSQINWQQYNPSICFLLPKMQRFWTRKQQAKDLYVNQVYILF